MNYEKINEVYEKLNQLKNRATYDILKAVCKRPGSQVKVVARNAHVDVNSTSKHISFLSSIGLVRTKEAGRELICFPNYREIERLNTFTNKLSKSYNPHIVVPNEKDLLEV